MDLGDIKQTSLRKVVSQRNNCSSFFLIIAFSKLTLHPQFPILKNNKCHGKCRTYLGLVILA